MIGCPACIDGVCQAGVKLGWKVATWLTRKRWRTGMTDEAFEAHSASTFAYGQAVHAWEQDGRPAGRLYGTDDGVLLAHREAIGRKFGLLPATKEEVLRLTKNPLVACEYGAERSTT